MTLPDKDSFATLGGVLENVGGVANARTDVDAVWFNKVRYDVAAMTRTAERAYARFTTAASTGALVLVAHESNWGNAVGVTPTLSRAAQGTFDITWPASVYDEMEPPVAHSLNLQWSRVNHRASSTFYVVNTAPISVNAARVYVRDSTFGLVDAVGLSVDVWVG
jgi:hypothetical protein